MPNRSNEPAPVGVVPRRQAQTIEPLMSDAPDTCTVAENIAPARREGPALPHWLSSVTALGVIAAALEWLKLTR